MATTRLDVFDKTIHKTNTLLKHIETELGWENHRNMSYAALRAVLHALRDRLTVQKAADLAAQLGHASCIDFNWRDFFTTCKDEPEFCCSLCESQICQTM